jgi:hypothetical protein
VRQRDAAVATQQLEDPGIEGRLTIHGFERVSIDTSLLNYCLDWPIKNPPYPLARQFPGTPTSPKPRPK